MATLTAMTGEVTVEMLTMKPSKGQSTSAYPQATQRSCKDSKHVHHQMRSVCWQVTGAVREGH